MYVICRIQVHMKYNDSKIKLFRLNIIINISLVLYLSFSFPPPLQSNYNPLKKNIHMADNFRSIGEFEKATFYYKKALIIATERNDIENRKQLLINLGLLYWNLGKMQISEDYFIEAKSLTSIQEFDNYSNFINKSIEIHNLYKKAKEHRSFGNNKKSVDCFNQAIELAREIGSKEYELKCFRQMSISYWNSNNLDNYYNANKQALELAHELNHKLEEARCLKNLGLYFWKIDNYSKAIKYFSTALSIAENHNYTSLVSDNLNLLGLAYRNVGEYDKSLEYLNKAKDISKDIGNNILLSFILNNIGNAYRYKALLNGHKKDFTNALNKYEQALSVATKNKDSKTQIEVLNNLGTVHSDLENYQKALEYFNQGYQMAEETFTLI